MRDRYAFGFAGGAGSVDYIGETVRRPTLPTSALDRSPYYPFIHAQNLYPTPDNLLSFSRLRHYYSRLRILQYVVYSIGGIFRIYRRISRPGLQYPHEPDDHL